MRPAQPILSIADTLSELSVLAYDHKSPAGDDWPFDSCREIGHVKYRILANESVGVVTVAGSDSFRDFLAWNTDTAIAEVGPYRLHRGFTSYAATVLADLRGISDLPEVFASGDWYCVGHSLGAAAAGIIPFLLREPDRIEMPCGVLGIGVPNFCVGSTSCLYPVRNAAFISSRWDFVSRVPLGAFFRQYTKPPVQYWIDDEGLSTYSGNQLTRFGWYVWQLTKLFGTRKSLLSLQEHSTGTYVRRIKSATIKLRTLELGA